MAIQDAAIGPQDFRLVKDINARDAVTPKKDGMIIYVQSEGIYYKYLSGAWIDFFIPLNSIVDLHKVENRVITAGEASAKELALNDIPGAPSEVVVFVIGGTTQKYNQDFVVSNNILSWNGYGMETIISQNDKLLILYVI